MLKKVSISRAEISKKNSINFPYAQHLHSNNALIFCHNKQINRDGMQILYVATEPLFENQDYMVGIFQKWVGEECKYETTIVVGEQ